MQIKLVGITLAEFAEFLELVGAAKKLQKFSISNYLEMMMGWKAC